MVCMSSLIVCGIYVVGRMAEETKPPCVQKQVSMDTYKWSNRKEDYQLLDVIGIYTYMYRFMYILMYTCACTFMYTCI